MKTLAFRSSPMGANPYLVAVHTTAAPDPDEWSAFVEHVEATLSGPSGPVHVFVATDGGGPNAAQRKEMVIAAERSAQQIATHVFTMDTITRGIVTAFRWITRAGASAHHPEQFPAVCTGCGLSPAEVLQEFARVQAVLPEVQMLDHMRKAAQLRGHVIQP